MNRIEYNERNAAHPRDVKHYDTALLREEFLIESVFEDDKVKLTYSGYDRFVAGGAVPKSDAIKLEPIDPMKAAYFCERRELGIINIGGTALITVDGTGYELGFKEALYITQGSRDIILASENPAQPAMLYLNSAPAHKSFNNKLIRQDDVNVIETGKEEDSNRRRIRQFIVSATCETCQLQMGITELQSGSVWNTMPPHTHSRRMEVYLYTDVKEGQAICHFMGEGAETRHIWLLNNQAVISPNWSIHAAAGTSNYSFIWGMAGENLDFGDMDGIKPTDLR
ncbi:MAG: 5-dehydro-4-deoxy-D-glucuronate isomerase [Tannerella sp.]|jgi:4-deoxy-L-threo-5-hexosulose-uronate ketol-isomerase|nr:5-dehydro-4-deoxy-D-glucuronate isomerase [Tannerella sp.]